MLPLLLACTPPDRAPDCALGGAHLLVATTDYEAGALAAVPLAGGCTADLLASAGRDPLVRLLTDPSGAPVVAVAERSGGDGVRLHDPGRYARPRDEFALPPGGNTHDVAAVPGGYVFARYDEASLTVTDGRGVRTGAVDLAPWAGADGLPEADRFATWDGRLFVALQRLIRGGPVWDPEPEGVVLELDPAALAEDPADAVLAAWPVGPNPKLAAGPSGLRVATGVAGRPDGAVAALDPDTGSLEVLADEADLGFDVWTVAEAPGGRVLAGLPFEPVSRPSTVVCAEGEAVVDGFVSDAVVPAGDDPPVWLAVRGDPTGGLDALVALDPATCAERERITGLRLPPYALAAVP